MSLKRRNIQTKIFNAECLPPPTALPARFQDDFDMVITISTPVCK
jgi:hypothetical protein